MGIAFQSICSSLCYPWLCSDLTRSLIDIEQSPYLSGVRVSHVVKGKGLWVWLALQHKGCARCHFNTWCIVYTLFQILSRRPHSDIHLDVVTLATAVINMNQSAEPTHSIKVTTISKIKLVGYHQCRILIDWATSRLLGTIKLLVFLISRWRFILLALVFV